ncbi:hypothetical protein [Actinomadura nitritigenes]|uniref:hypothetical protein n=1 Tax=Actinomadura nitritigenes TaxID=134602 RepID=UPI003D8E8D5A
MTDPQDAQAVVEALALTGATTVVAAMATEAWQATRTRTARLFHRQGRAASAVEAQLDGDAELVGSEDDPDGTRRELVGPWKRRFAALLRELPESEADLRALIDDVRADLPVAQRVWLQNNTADDHAVVNAVQHGNQYTFYMDTPGPGHRARDRSGAASGDGEAEA